MASLTVSKAVIAFCTAATWTTPITEILGTQRSVSSLQDETGLKRIRGVGERGYKVQGLES